MNPKKQNNRRPQRPQNNKQGNKAQQQAPSKPRPRTTDQARSASRGEAIRAQRRSHDDAHRMIEQYNLTDL
ncbi:hypothetical protein KC959_01350, partial [Candidatus Saccharibacteria bacterium]|nr:hypothetical protein [Candidatus Saccharibacteria bacterium]